MLLIVKGQTNLYGLPLLVKPFMHLFSCFPTKTWLRLGKFIQLGTISVRGSVVNVRCVSFVMFLMYITEKPFTSK